MRALTSLALLFALCASAGAAESAARLQRARSRPGAWVGPAVVTGHLGFAARSARVETALTALPALAFGLDLWPTEALGLYAGGAIGLGARISVPGTDSTIAYNLHQFEGGVRGRWFLGPRANAPAALVGVGLRGLYQTTQVQRPALLVDRIIAGPELAAGVTWPVLVDRLVLRLWARGQLPFFVRETPTDSGDPRSFSGYGARAEASLRLDGAWGILAQIDWWAIGVDFAGEGTRAAGVDDASTDDSLIMLALSARYAF
mgnify:CR=1 FL=1